MVAFEFSMISSFTHLRIASEQLLRVTLACWGNSWAKLSTDLRACETPRLGEIDEKAAIHGSSDEEESLPLTSFVKRSDHCRDQDSKEGS